MKWLIAIVLMIIGNLLLHSYNGPFLKGYAIGSIFLVAGIRIGSSLRKK